MVRKQNGITLIALVITIILLLILAGISIATLKGDNGILTQANKAKTETVIGKEEEQIRIAYDSVIINKLGNDVTANELQIELDKIVTTSVTDNEDGTLNVLFNDTKHNYTVNKGEISKNDDVVNWEKILADATANPDNYKHTEQSLANGDIGIGTDGNPVNLDLWSYEVINNNQIRLSKKFGCKHTPGYKNSNVVGGKIIGKVPQYIKINGNSEFFAVTDMYYVFDDCTSLTTAPEIPSSATMMEGTFYDCTSLATAPTIPLNVTYMSSTFSGCTSLATAPTIPSGVTYMGNTFANCTSLATAPTIPSGVTYMGYTFANCTSLATAPTIPPSVINMRGTFFDCSKLQGTIEINANPKNYYDNCFIGAATEGPGLVVKGSSTMLDTIIATKSTISNITKGT